MNRFVSSHLKMRDSKRLAKPLLCLVFAGVLMFSMSIPMGLAFAANTPEAGSQSGTGKTTFKVITQNSGLVSGTNDASNSDGDNDGLGDNLAFSVPTSINFVAKADGELVGPSNLDIRNMSVFPIHVGQMQVNALNGFNIVANASESDLPNALDLSIGPEEDLMSITSGTTTYNMSNPVKWNMGAVGVENGNYDADLDFNVVGHLNNVTKDISTMTDFLEVNWYVESGEAITPFEVKVYADEVSSEWSAAHIDTSHDSVATTMDTVIYDGNYVNASGYPVQTFPRGYVVLDADEEAPTELALTTDAETGDSYMAYGDMGAWMYSDISGGLDSAAWGSDYKMTCEEFFIATGLTSEDMVGKTLYIYSWPFRATAQQEI